MTAHAGDRHRCPRCGRSIALTFGGVRLSPHNTGPGGARCDGSRMALADVEREHATSQNDTPKEER